MKKTKEFIYTVKQNLILYFNLLLMSTSIKKTVVVFLLVMYKLS